MRIELWMRVQARELEVRNQIRFKGLGFRV